MNRDRCKALEREAAQLAEEVAACIMTSSCKPDIAALCTH